MQVTCQTPPHHIITELTLPEGTQLDEYEHDKSNKTLTHETVLLADPLRQCTPDTFTSRETFKLSKAPGILQVVLSVSTSKPGGDLGSEGSHTLSRPTISSPFNSLLKVLFIFPSQYLFAVGLRAIFSLR